MLTNIGLFFKSLFHPSLNTVKTHLNRADDLKAQHVDALLDAQDAAIAHNTNAQATITALTQTIGQVQGQINQGNAHLNEIEAALSKVA